MKKILTTSKCKLFAVSALCATLWMAGGGIAGADGLRPRANGGAGLGVRDQ